MRWLVASVVQSGELETVSIDWVTPRAHQLNVWDAGWVALRVMVSAVGDVLYEREVWAGLVLHLGRVAGPVRQ